jgi:NADPH2:quinone reductase
LKKGETVLIHAAAGALGLMAVQIAKAIGCRVIATVGSKEKLAVAKRFGADAGVDYVQDADEWWKIVLELTGGQGVDVVYDPVGLVVSMDAEFETLKIVWMSEIVETLGDCSSVARD